MTAVSARNISLSHGSCEILHGLTLAVERKNFFVIVGPNGAGKSTLLKTLSGAEKITEGTISLFDKPQNHYSRQELARLVAIVPQEFAENFPFKVADTVLMGRSPHLGLLGREQKRDYDIARRAMEETDTIHLAHRTLNELSGGEKQRVIIARAICQQPKIIFLDEPTAALDLAHQIRIMDLLDRLRRKKNITVCMVSHDINLAAMYADTLLLLVAGRIVKTGPAGRVLTSTLLEKSYGCPLQVDDNPLTGTKRVSPVPARFKLP